MKYNAFDFCAKRYPYANVITYESGTIFVYSIFALRTLSVTGYIYEGKPLCDTVVSSTTV